MKKKNRKRFNHPSTQDKPKTLNSWSITLGDKWPEGEAKRGQNQQQRTIPSKALLPAPLEIPSRIHRIQPTPDGSKSNKKILKDISQQLPVKPSQSENRPLPISESTKPVSNNRSQTRQANYADRINQSLLKKGADKKREITIILGIDFGTSSTKVVWREVESDRAHLICFGNHPESIEDYLLPSIVAFDDDQLAAGLDVLSFSEKNPQANAFSNFKMCLACVSSEKSDCNLERCSLSLWRPLLVRMVDGTFGNRETIETISALHIGKVISLSRKHIVENLRARGMDPQIRWLVNMAAPVQHIDENSILESFERVLKIGWWMAEIFDDEAGPYRLDDLLDCYKTAKHFAATRAMNCFIYPEVAAEVACMYLSRSARDGIYAFVDVGAGTLDASIFRLASTGSEPQLNFYGASVIKYGAAHLEAIASRQLAERACTWFKSIKESRAAVGSAMFLLPEEAGVYLKNAYGWTENKVESELRHLLKESFAKEQDSKSWKGLHLFIGGGGANIRMYTDASIKAFRGLATNLTVEELSLPQDFEMNGLPKKAFHRFAVAYGLSFNVVNLAEIALPDEISDMTRETVRPIRKSYEAPTKDVC